MRGVFLFLLLLSASYADLKNDLANRYAEGVNTILFFTSEDVICSGHYTFDNFGDKDVHKFYAVFSYDDVPNFSEPVTLEINQ